MCSQVLSSPAAQPVHLLPEPPPQYTAPPVHLVPEPPVHRTLSPPPARTLQDTVPQFTSPPLHFLPEPPVHSTASPPVPPLATTVQYTRPKQNPSICTKTIVTIRHGGRCSYRPVLLKNSYLHFQIIFFILRFLIQFMARPTAAARRTERRTARMFTGVHYFIPIC